MEIERVLEQIGLNEREVRVYLATLELGESTVLPISKKSGIKRTYCYDILADLIKKNLVSYYEKNNRRRYLAEDPEKIRDILNNQLNQFNQVLPDLKSLFNRSATKPKIRFYEGKEGVISVYDQILKTDSILAIASPDHILAEIGDYFTGYAQRMMAKKVRVKELVTSGSQNLDYLKDYQLPDQEARFLPDGVQISTDMIIFESKLAMISYVPDLHAVVIESSSIVETQKVLFEIIWSQARPFPRTG